MKLALDLGKLRQANVWLDDLPAANFDSKEIKEISLPTTRTLEGQRQAAIEVFVPVGARMIYGLLGGILTPAAEALRVEIHISEDRTKRFEETVMKHETVFVGLPREYVPGIERAFALGGKHVPDLMAGNLKLTHAAHGEVSSNQAIFGHLTISLLKLLSLEDFRPIEGQIIKIFPETLAHEIA